MPNSSIHTVLYDEKCALCRFKIALLSWLDWFGCARLVPLSDPLAAKLAPNLTRQDLLAEIHCVSAEGDIYRGVYALRFLGMRIPLYVPLALFLWLPGVIGLASLVYRFVSRHRYLISRLFGCKTACQWVPPKQEAKTSKQSTSSNNSEQSV
ncbi:MAG: DUF393 domain-containing protein [Pirellulaceae bacterium]|nr:DUF393 domain-containing protein [Pirellulaceae bacterium]